MHFTRFRLGAACALGWLVLCASAFPASAAGKDQEAQALLDQAINEDYLAVDFGKAEAKLLEALKACKKDGCSRPMLGKLHIALGTVYANTNPQRQDEAKEEFVAALQADANAALDPSLKVPAMETLFKEAQAAAAARNSTKEAQTAEAAKPKNAGGDLSFTPKVSEQLVNTPVPIYVEIQPDLGAEKAVLKYKPFGTKAYKTIAMVRMGAGFGIEIPCEDVTTTGDLKYYIIAKDAEGDPVGTAGSATEPYRVTIRNDIDSAAPALPGRRPPEQCKAKEDCPPGLPGCTERRKYGTKGWGDSCEASEECKSGFVCLDGSCEEGKRSGEEAFFKSRGKAKKNYASLLGSLDLSLIRGGTDVCSGSSGNHACFYQAPDSHAQFYGNPQPVAKAAGTDSINGGLGIGGVTLLLAYDRLFFEKLGISAGVRLGVTLGGSPSPDNTAPSRYSGSGLPSTQVPAQSSFLPFHGELRVAYHFGKAPMEYGKIRPFTFLGGGIAQVNASVPVTVCDTVNTAGAAIDPTTYDTKGICKGQGKATNLTAYQVTGLNFIGLGGGATYGLTPSFGLSLELKVMFMLPTFGVVFAPTLGPTFAF